MRRTGRKAESVNFILNCLGFCLICNQGVGREEDEIVETGTSAGFRRRHIPLRVGFITLRSRKLSLRSPFFSKKEEPISKLIPYDFDLAKEFLFNASDPFTKEL